MGTASPELLRLFDELASFSADKRIQATVAVVAHIDGVKDEGDKAKCVLYCIRRLVRGLASPRKAARLGFATALAELVGRVGEVTMEAVVNEMERVLCKDCSGREGRMNAIGFIIGLVALLESQQTISRTDILLSLTRRRLPKILSVYGSMNCFAYEPIVLLINKCDDETFKLEMYPMIEEMCQLNTVSKKLLDALPVLLVVKRRFQRFASKHIPLMNGDQLYQNENLKEMSNLAKNCESSPIPHPGILACVRDSMLTDKFRNFWTTVVGEIIESMAKNFDIKGIARIVDTILDSDSVTMEHLEVILSPKYFVILFSTYSGSAAMHKGDLILFRCLLGAHLQRVLQFLSGKEGCSDLLCAVFKALLTDGAALGQKLKLRLVAQTIKGCGQKTAQKLLDTVQSMLADSPHTMMCLKAMAQLARGEHGDDVRLRVFNFCLQGVLSNGEGCAGTDGEIAVDLKTKLANCFLTVYADMFYVDMSKAKVGLAVRPQFFRRYVDFLSDAISKEGVKSENRRCLQKALQILRSAPGTLENQDSLRWSLYCWLLFSSSLLLLNIGTKETLQKVIDLYEGEPPRMQFVLECIMHLVTASELKCRTVALVTFSHLTPLVTFDQLSSIFQFLGQSLMQDENAGEDEPMEDDEPLEDSGLSEMSTDEDLVPMQSASLQEDLVDLADLEDLKLDISDGLVGELSDGLIMKDKDGADDRKTYAQLTCLDMLRLVMNSTSDAMIIMPTFTFLLGQLVHLLSEHGEERAVIVDRVFRCMYEMRKVKLVYDVRKYEEVAVVKALEDSLEAIVKAASATNSLKYRQDEFRGLLVKSLMYFFTQEKSAGDLREKMEETFRKTSVKYLLQLGSSDVMKRKLSGICFHALPALVRAAFDEAVKISQRINALHACVHLLRNQQALTAVKKEISVWLSFCKELKHGFFVYHNEIMKKRIATEGAVGIAEINTLNDADFFLSLLELFLQLVKVGRRMDLSALVDAEFLCNLRHFNRPKFWNRPEATRIRRRMTKSYPLGAHKLLADLYRSFQSCCRRDDND